IAVAAVSLQAQAAKCDPNAAASNCAQTATGAAALGVSAAKEINDICMQLSQEFSVGEECAAPSKDGVCIGQGRPFMRKVGKKNMCCKT
ncbi:MAG: hypothetical protein NTX25_08010, partial [Proteobacteria bacterium]|nr:hypothetical protein [Pseudomonadota bacterium]